MKFQNFKDKVTDIGIKFTLWVAKLGVIGYVIALLLKWILCTFFNVCIF